MLKASVTPLCLPLQLIWDVMWHWVTKVLNLYPFPQKRHLRWLLSQPPECFLTRSSAQNVLRRSSSSIRCSGAVVWRFCISVSSNPFLRGISLPVSDFVRFRLEFWEQKIIEWEHQWEPWHDPFLEGGKRIKMHKIWSESDKYRVSYTSRRSVSFVRWPPTWRQVDVNWRQGWRDS